MEWFIHQCYEQWIEENIPKDELVGNCTMWVRVMQQAFPELTMVGGYIKGDGSAFFSFFNFNYHEYLVTEDGAIVDPTKVQFDALLGKGKWCYERWEEHLLY